MCLYVSTCVYVCPQPGSATHCTVCATPLPTLGTAVVVILSLTEEISTHLHIYIIYLYLDVYGQHFYIVCWIFTRSHYLNKCAAINVFERSQLLTVSTEISQCHPSPSTCVRYVQTSTRLDIAYSIFIQHLSYKMCKFCQCIYKYLGSRAVLSKCLLKAA